MAISPFRWLMSGSRTRKPYLCQVPAQMVRGWRTEQNRSTSELTMVRYMERISVPSGEFGEEIIDQVRVLKQGSYQLWREDTDGAAYAGWVKVEDSETSLSEIRFVTLCSNQIATLVSKPPLLEVANLSLTASASRTTTTRFTWARSQSS